MAHIRRTTTHLLVQVKLATGLRGHFRRAGHQFDRTPRLVAVADVGQEGANAILNEQALKVQELTAKDAEELDHAALATAGPTPASQEAEAANQLLRTVAELRKELADTKAQLDGARAELQHEAEKSRTLADEVKALREGLEAANVQLQQTTAALEEARAAAAAEPAPSPAPLPAPPKDRSRR